MKVFSFPPTDCPKCFRNFKRTLSEDHKTISLSHYFAPYIYCEDQNQIHILTTAKFIIEI